MARQRLTEDFVRHYEVLRDRTGNNPFGIRGALTKNPQLAVSIRELDRLWDAFEEHRKFSKHRFIVQAHPKFDSSFRAYQARWRRAWLDLRDWEDEQAGREPFSVWFAREMLDSSTAEAEGSQEEERSEEEEQDWDFDSERHSAASLVEGVAEYIRSCKADDEPFFSRAAGAFDWLSKSVNLDLSKIEERWREFPVIRVPQHVSDKHALNNTDSLYGYLTQVRLAYMIGADLAAIAMCRSATEMLIRFHYNNDSQTKLGPLIKRTEEQKQNAFLRKHNIGAKVEEANKILHIEKHDIKTVNLSRALILDWVIALQEIIASAPTPNMVR